MMQKENKGVPADIEGGIPLLEKMASRDKEVKKDKKQFRPRWRSCDRQLQPSLMKTIFKTFSVYIAMAMTYRLAIEVFVFLNPVIIRSVE